MPLAAPSTDASKRRRLLAKGPGNEKAMEGFAKNLQIEQHREALKKVLGYLEKDADLTTRTLFMLESGKLAPAATASAGCLPPSSNKFRLIHADAKHDLVTHLIRVPQTMDFLRAAKKTDKTLWDKVLQFGLRIHMNCAVFSKTIVVLHDKAAERHAAIGHPLANLKITGGEVQWSECGAWSYGPAGAAAYTFVETKNPDIRVDLACVGQSIDGTWTIDRNWDVSTACVKKGRYSEKIWRFLSDAQREQLQPLCHDRVPFGASGLIASPRSASGSSGIADTPPSVRRTPAVESPSGAPSSGPSSASAPVVALPPRSGDFLGESMLEDPPMGST